MKVAVIYNRVSDNVINLFGVPNREKYGRKSIDRLVEALRKGDHQVVALEGDKDLVDRLQEFMPRVLKGERPGIAFNISYGIQGQARYTHVPSILEMVGIPYVGSGPLAHSLALDKVVAKMIFKQRGIPTPDFAVLYGPGFDAPDLEYPLIVKPKNEARSFGLKVVNDEAELRAAADVIFKEFGQDVLAERFIKGREINVGIIGNNPPEAFAPVELVFGKGGPDIYTLEDKEGKSGREIGLRCPAAIDDALIAKAQEISKQAFNALGCYDCCRVDLRLDDQDNLFVLEINSLPSLGARGSFVAAAQQAGLDFDALANRLVEVAAARYFGTARAPRLSSKEATPQELVAQYVSERRDRLETRLESWTRLSSRLSDPVGLNGAVERLGGYMAEVGMKPSSPHTDERVVWTWQTERGFEDGTLIIAHLDVPMDVGTPVQGFRRDPEWLFGDGIGTSRAPLTSLEFALRALRHQRRLRRQKIGVLAYTDEGHDCRYSGKLIRSAAAAAREVLVLRPGQGRDSFAIHQRRGQRKYRLRVEGEPRRLGIEERKPEIMRWLAARVEPVIALGSRKRHLAVGLADVTTDAFPGLLPHRVTATLFVSYRDGRAADEAEEQIREILGKKPPSWDLELISDRPPLAHGAESKALATEIAALAKEWEVPIDFESSAMPSVAGLVPEGTAVLCGLGPTARDLHTPHEAVDRVSLVQRTLLLAQILARGLRQEGGAGKKADKKDAGASAKK